MVDATSVWGRKWLMLPIVGNQWWGFQWLGPLLWCSDYHTGFTHQWLGQWLGWGYECIVLQIVGLPMVRTMVGLGLRMMVLQIVGPPMIGTMVGLGL
jgi:hypothetical protein